MNIHEETLQGFSGRLSVNCLRMRGKCSFKIVHVHCNNASTVRLWLEMENSVAISHYKSHNFSVSERTVYRYIALFQQTGDVQSKERRNGLNGGVWTTCASETHSWKPRNILTWVGCWTTQYVWCACQCAHNMQDTQINGLHKTSNAPDSTTKIRC